MHASWGTHAKITRCEIGLRVMQQTRACGSHGSDDGVHRVGGGEQTYGRPSLQT